MKVTDERLQELLVIIDGNDYWNYENIDYRNDLMVAIQELLTLRKEKEELVEDSERLA